MAMYMATTGEGHERDWHAEIQHAMAGSIWKLCGPICFGSTRSTGAAKKKTVKELAFLGFWDFKFEKSLDQQSWKRMKSNVFLISDSCTSLPR